ncbi:glycosyltransferase family 2 protein [Pontiella sp.]|uniref:glycosyltransferase family 2 protein n=1 Tax=Pontiella sp. TaxID=2837462 RepID=UPI0035643D1A
MPESVAIIMRAKNEMPHVRRALDMLARQTCGDFDLFAVDSGSTDGTLEALEEYGANLVRISPEAYVPGKVLNEAIAATRHETIVFLNADAVPQSTDWLENLLRPLRENLADAVFSKQIARPDATFIVAYDYERAYDPAKIEPGFFSAVACAFRRKLWEQTRFPEEGYAEDVRWAKACLETGARIRPVPESVVEHSHNYTLAELRQKRFRQARALRIATGPLAQTGKCLREIIRDLLHAIVRFKLHTIPYNLAYRIAIHRGVFSGRA